MIAHGLPIRYLPARSGRRGPRPVLEKVDYATPYKVTRQELLEAVDDLRRWAENPPGQATANPSGACGAPRPRPIMTEECGAGSLRLGSQSSRLRCC